MTRLEEGEHRSCYLTQLKWGNFKSWKEVGDWRKRMNSETIKWIVWQNEREQATKKLGRLRIKTIMNSQQIDEETPHPGIECRQIHQFRDAKVISHSGDYIRNQHVVYGGPPLVTGTFASRHKVCQHPIRWLDCIHTGRMYLTYRNGKSHVWSNVPTKFWKSFSEIEIIYPTLLDIWRVALSRTNYSPIRRYSRSQMPLNKIISMTGPVPHRKRRSPWHTGTIYREVSRSIPLNANNKTESTQRARAKRYCRHYIRNNVEPLTHSTAPSHEHQRQLPVPSTGACRDKTSRSI